MGDRLSCVKLKAVLSRLEGCQEAVRRVAGPEAELLNPSILWQSLALVESLQKDRSLYSVSMMT